MRLELTRSCDHYPLKVACIPISPPAQSAQNRTRTCTPRGMRTCNARVYQFRHLGKKKGAENETRTRDPNLGKVVLYQLSYFRLLLSAI